MESIDIKTIQEEDQAFIKRASDGDLIAKHKESKEKVQVEDQKTEEIVRLKAKIAKLEKSGDNKDINIKAQVDFPEVQKVEGRVDARVNFPEEQKVTGMQFLLDKLNVIQALLKAIPKVFEIKGSVDANVEFPETQDVEVKNFPETQNIKGKVKTDIPLLLIGDREVVPIVFFDGKRAVNPFTSTVQGNGKLATIMQNVLNELRGSLSVETTPEAAPSTLVSFITTITTAGTEVNLADNAVSAGILQAPSTNTGNIFVHNANTVSSSVFGSELQPGQSVGVAIDNTNKLWVDAATSGDKIAFMGS